MEYKIDIFSAIKAIIFSWPIALVLFSFLIVIPAILLWVKTNKKVSYISLLMVLHTIITLSIIFQFSFLIMNTVGSRIQLSNNRLAINASLISETIDLSLAKVALVSDEEWHRARKIKGLDAYDLYSGIFELKNGRQAIVFEHMGGATSMVLFYKQKFYLINYPGIELLYDEVVKNNVEHLNI